MTTENWIATLALFLTTIASCLIVFFKLGRLVEAIESMKETLRDVPHLKYSVESMKGTLETTVKDVHQIKYSLAQVIVKVDDLWKERGTASKSPRVLNDFGRKVLETSGITHLTDKYYTEILEKVKEHAPRNAFQAQEAVVNSLLLLKTKEDCRGTLENGAFVSGTGIDMVLFVAAINLRDKVFSDLGFDSRGY